MTDYEPIDLSEFCNAGLTVLSEKSTAPTGAQSFLGLPFLVGDAAGAGDRCFIALGDGITGNAIRIPVCRSARRVVVAHRLLESQLQQGGPVGVPVAEYRFHLVDGQTVVAPIRERYDISAFPFPRGAYQYRGVTDQQHRVPPRHAGRWERAGDRQLEVEASRPSYTLWVWANPQPEVPISAIEIVAKGPRFIVAGITLGQLDEHPFLRDGARDVRILLPQAEDAGQPFDLEVEVDRGIATYAYPLPIESAEAFLAADFRGWGEAQNPQSSASYVGIAAIPSATVAVKQNGVLLGSARWGEIEQKRAIDAGPRLRIELIDPGRNWVRTTVLDDDTGRPVPCRIHFRSPDGVPYQPHGHHNHVNSNNGTWHFDVGGDVRLGQITYAYIDGTCQGWLPRGEVLVDVARGYEYEPIRTRVQIDPGQQELTLRLKRWCNMNRERWFSGDSHVHFLSTQGSHTEAQGEDLNVVNLLQSQWGGLFTSTEEFTGEPSVSRDGRSIVYINQENRQHFLGHLILLGLKRPVMPWCSDGPGEAELGGTLEITMSDWADQCHAQGGTVIIPHHPSPNGEPAVLIATGRADAVEMMTHAPFNHVEYYRYLNCGYRLPLVGGTDKMSSDVPVGIYRTYVQIPSDEEFTYANWCRNVAKGRTFHSGGPILHFSIDGKEIGDTLMLPGNGGTVEVAASAESILPIHRLEIVQQGRVVAATEEAAGTRRLSLQARLQVAGNTWLAARVGGPGYMNAVPHFDLWRRGVFAHTSPIYVACGGEWEMFDQPAAQYMLTLVDGALTYIRETSYQHRPGTVTHHHGADDHLAYLERPFHEAREAIHRRMHALGIGH